MSELDDRTRIEKLGRKAGSTLRVHEVLKARPIQGISDVATSSGLTFPTVATAMEQLATLGIVRELTGKERNRLFAYDAYLEILNEGTESL